MFTSRFVFLQPPENFNPRVEVAGCFVRQDRHFLFLKRCSGGAEPNAWGVPGGKVEKMETAEMCGRREVWEETGIDLTGNTLRCFNNVYVRYPEIDFIYWMFEACLSIEGSFPPVILNPAEHVEHRWLYLEEALLLPLIRGEEECISLVYPKTDSTVGQEPILIKPLL